MGLGHVCAHSEGTLMAVLRARVSVRAGLYTLRGQRVHGVRACREAGCKATSTAESCKCTLLHLGPTASLPPLCLPSLHTHSSSHVRCSSHADAGFRNGSGAPCQVLSSAQHHWAQHHRHQRGGPVTRGSVPRSGCVAPRRRAESLVLCTHSCTPRNEQELTRTAHPHEYTLAHSYVCE